MENVVVLDVNKVDLVLHGADTYLPNINVIPDEDGPNVDQELRSFRPERRNKKNPNPRKKKKVPEEILAGEAAIDKGFKILEEIRRIDMLAN
ncbi:hypothetical protein H5410_004016 [Solanum commersonii]|uniref:Uncharacterized protein n=1 Tax=Solanum commersonii TaxID=4109 RepID=A0A9J6B6R3_SOLCO|nr:hypothetical protein H5410_004016 [Solanum commersonii]